MRDILHLMTGPEGKSELFPENLNVRCHVTMNGRAVRGKTPVISQQ